MAEIDDRAIGFIFADPPYFLSGSGTTCRSGARAPVSKGSWDAKISISSQVAFAKSWICEAKRVLSSHGSMCVCGSMHSIHAIGVALLSSEWRILNQIVWEKPNPPPNLGRRCLTHSHEYLIWAAPHAQSRYTFRYDLLRKDNGGKQMKDVWRFSTPRVRGRARHPAEKPVRLVSRCIEAFSPAGSTVLDPFSGSGSTAIAALKSDLELKFVGIEQDQQWNDLAAKRIEDIGYQS